MSHYEEIPESADSRESDAGGVGVASAVLSVLREFLYMFSVHAGNVLMDQYSRAPTQQRQAEWLRRVLSWNAEELTEWVGREGDEEDKMVFLNVFLWKQRHGIMDAKLRIHHGFRRWPDAFYIHRYMAANGYEFVLSDPQYSDQKTGYLKQIGLLLDSFSNADFGEEDFWGLLMRLNVLGPKFDTYERKGEALKVADYVLARYKDDARLRDFASDVSLSTLALLFSDLGLDPTRTWPLFAEALLRSPRRSVSCYPALKVGHDTYGSRFSDAMREVEVQGGNKLFFALSGPTE